MSHCECTKEDWECDVGFERNGDGPCVSINNKPISYDAPKFCKNTYTVS